MATAVLALWGSVGLAASPTWLPATALPAGWEPAGEPSTFNADNLYEHIDGAAPGYLRYSFRRMTCQFVRSAADPKTQIEVEVYEFGTHLDAFGIYSSERGPGLTFAKLGAQGYYAGPACRFYRGPYYVKLVATREDTSTQAAEAVIARTLARRLRGDTKPPALLKALPSSGLVSGSERYEGSDLLAHDFLGAGFTAEYDLGGRKPAKLFFALKPSPTEARQAYLSLLAFMRKRGEVGKGLDLLGGTARAVKHPFYGPSVVGHAGAVVCGVLRVPSDEAGTALLLDLLRRLDDVRP